ncbi:MAG: TfoX/Sxy family protein [Gammaproteobacteria bacterium]
MPYDEGLAERVREALGPQQDVSEKKMFGGLAFLSRGYMFVGIVGDNLMARVGPDDYEQALARAYVREMDFTGKPMKGYVFVASPGLEDDSELYDWVRRCHRFVQSLPPKNAK